MMRILAVGNSFSQDATALLEYLAPQFTVRNLYIPGCPLAYHAELAATQERAYELQEGGDRTSPALVSIDEGIADGNWDVITVQQASGDSGMEESYQPHLDKLLAYLRARSSARILFHQTWAYEVGCENPHFARYGCDRQAMWQAIERVSTKVCAQAGLPMLRTGTLIARLRRHALFDPVRGGLSLCRDGFHLSLGFGRVAAAALWARCLIGEMPAFLQRGDISKGFRLIAEELENMARDGLLSL